MPKIIKKDNAPVFIYDKESGTYIQEDSKRAKKLAAKTKRHMWYKQVLLQLLSRMILK